MAAVLACVAGFFTMLIVRGGTPAMALLYADLDARDGGQIAEQLDAQHIPHVVSPGGNAIMVPSAEVGRVRLLLARQGLPTGGSIGYEIFDKSDGLTATQFQEQVTQLRALEGELARTIRGVSGVRAARVHLVLPHREPFEREQQAAQASIMLTMTGGARLDQEGTQAVLSLVVAAVPGLRPHNVSIIDSRGDVLARAGAPAATVEAAQNLDELRQAIAIRLEHAVEDMLEPTVGRGKVRAQATVELDASKLSETKESFDPDGKVERSTQNVSDSTRSSEPQPTVSVQNNLPNADTGSAAGGGSQSQRQEETTNFEIGKTVRTTAREEPEVKRISIAVLIDETESTGADGKPSFAPRAHDELDQIASLVKGAVGFDEKRGDKVEVVSLPFSRAPDPIADVDRHVLGLAVSPDQVSHLVQTAFLGILALVGLLFIVRPMLVHISSAKQDLLVTQLGSFPASSSAKSALALGPTTLANDSNGQLAASPANADEIARQSSPMLALTHDAGSGEAVYGDDDAMINVSNVEGQLRASAMRKIAALVAQHPDESLAIIRGWMQQETS